MARPRTSEVSKSLDGADEPAQGLARSSVAGCCAHARFPVSRRGGRGHSQPPVNPARRSPATRYGQRRMMSQIRPVR